MTEITPLSTAQRIETTFARISQTFLGLGLIALVLINVANAVGRYTGWFAMTGADEALVYGMIWIVMLGAILAARERSHLSVNLLQLGMSERNWAAFQLVIDAVTLLVSVLVAVQSWDFIGRIFAIGQVSMGLGIPMILPHSAIFVGFAGIAVVTSVLLITDIVHLKSKGGPK